MDRSLKSALLAWLLLPLAVVGLFNVWTTYRSALDLADLRSDQALLASARSIAESLHMSDGQPEAPIPPAALELFATGTPDKVVYRVSTKAGTLLAGNPGLTLPAQDSLSLSPHFFDTSLSGERLRAVGLAQPVFSGGAEETINVLVAQTRAGHDQFVSGLWLKSLRDQGLLIGAAGLLALYGLSRGLRPLNRLGRQLAARDARNLAAVDATDVHAELLPLVAAINGALAKVEAQVASQRRFIANAAHQLRTPLALLRTQAQVGLRASRVRPKDEALQAVAQSTVTLSRLVTQLLSLARAEQGPSLLRKEPVDLAGLMRQVVEAHLAASFARDQDLGLEGAGSSVMVFGHASLLREMLGNLIDNALRYAPERATITLRLREQGGEAQITVEDNGPGLSAAALAKPFERFERGEARQQDGSGLGLAIVQEIVRAHEGTITLAARPGGPGLVVRIVLPLAAAQAASAEVWGFHEAKRPST
ncbi:MAG: sensor histidine kinase N-terminal domain-containing protein [Alphaproteobacteria bacterium]|nr:sensor histidine kinase N-terminal domain-containing protein [Alphaproteobacteria bacterium]